MLYLSVPLTVLALAMVGVMLLATKYLTGNSGKYFIKQQQELGKVNGYIEEMMNGQKVIKVFCHEEIAIEEFDRLNDELFHSADKANSYSLVAMPVNGQLGNLSYVFCAILGGALAINASAALRWAPRQLPCADPPVQPAHQPDFHAAELRRYGAGRRALSCAAG